MTRPTHPASRPLSAVVLAAVLLITGCLNDPLRDNQAWLNNPSVISNPNFTPGVMPILSEIDMIDEPAEHIPGLDEPTARDLIPSNSLYRMVAGDTVSISVFELFRKGTDTILNRRIDESGYIRLPKVGRIKAAGLSDRQLEQRLMEILIKQGLLVNPTVHVAVLDGRKKVYSVIGAAGSGTYQIVPNNFRLLDALALARATVTPEIKKLYVIRQVALKEMVESGPVQPGVQPGHHIPPQAPKDPAARSETKTGREIFSDITGLVRDPNRLPEDGADESQKPQRNHLQGKPGLGDVLDPTRKGEGRFLNIDGRWIWVEGVGPKQQADRSDPAGQSLPPIDQLVTQRIIEIDAHALRRGDARQNIVIRPGDVIRVPIPVTGNVFIGGHGINRGGTYTLPGEKQLTLRQLVISAGELSPIGIPERVELRRRLGDDREAIVRLNLRAIAEGVQPDIYLKPNDTINVGTNFFATPQAVVRNGFRMSYGFGFLLDRNFNNDVFGPGGN
ncbi:MAG: polysaccharide biosynthesis/export family protein [Phycisphaeraceae bacterium]|nr:polysaccharide biosynthesis/export family protein [Phycisphaeraceae bacterium]